MFGPGRRYELGHSREEQTRKKLKIKEVSQAPSRRPADSIDQRLIRAQTEVRSHPSGNNGLGFPPALK